MTSSVFNQHKLNLKLKVEVGGLDLVKRFVEEGIGISIVSSICLAETDKLVVRDMSQYFPSRDYGLLLRKGRYLSPQVKNFINIVKRQQVVHQSFDAMIDNLNKARLPMETAAV